MLQWESPTGRVSALILDTSHDWTVFSKANGAGMSTKSPYPPFFCCCCKHGSKRYRSCSTLLGFTALWDGITLLRSVPTFSSYVLSSPPVSNEALRGSSPQAQSQVLQWVSFADAEIIPPASAWVFPTLGIMQFNKQVCTVYHCILMVFLGAFQLLELHCR